MAARHQAYRWDVRAQRWIPSDCTCTIGADHGK